MNKFALKICTIFFAAVAILLAVMLYRDIPADTAAYKDVVCLRNNVELDFRPQFNYGHKLSIQFVDSVLINSADSISISLQNKADFTNLSLRFPIAELCTNGIYLGQLAYDNYQMKIGDLAQSLINKRSFIQVDVVGGGPSVSLAWERELRPYFWIILLVCLAIVVISVFLISKSTHSS